MNRRRKQVVCLQTVQKSDVKDSRIIEARSLATLSFSFSSRMVDQRSKKNFNEILPMTSQEAHFKKKLFC